MLISGGGRISYSVIRTGIPVDALPVNRVTDFPFEVQMAVRGARVVLDMREKSALGTVEWEPFQKREPGEGEKPCPYDGIAYSQVPGYVSGYGCPVCEAISAYHLPVPVDTEVDTSKA